MSENTNVGPATFANAVNNTTPATTTEKKEVFSAEQISKLKAACMSDDDIAKIIADRNQVSPNVTDLMNGGLTSVEANAFCKAWQSKKDNAARIEEKKEQMAYESALKAEQQRLDREIQKNNEPTFGECVVKGCKTAVAWTPTVATAFGIGLGTVVLYKKIFA